MLDIAIVGAGMAGLTAARTLAEAGRSVSVFEARERTGGRILTIHDPAGPLELGAEFIHGRPADLWALIREAGFATYELDGSTVRAEDGRPIERDEQDPGGLPAELRHWREADRSFLDYLNAHPYPLAARQRLIGFVEGFNAADAAEISVAALAKQQEAEDAIDGERLFRIRGGYDSLPRYLAQRFVEAGGRLQLSAPVSRLSWRRHSVCLEIAYRNGAALYEARQLVIAVPLGVLLSGRMRISPAPSFLGHATHLRMGNAFRFTMLFRETFWRQHRRLDALSFVFSPGGMPPVWWTPHPAPTPSITGWAGGPRSRELQTLREDELKTAACGSLAAALSIPRAHVDDQLVRIVSHDWLNDLFSAGAYSYVAVGGLDASSRMAEPVEDTLFLAGEHTDTTGHWGTVHAAVRSGLRAAEQVLATTPHR